MLCGLPGTGKTTYANALGEFLSTRKNLELGMTDFPGYKVISLDSVKDHVAKEKDAVYNRSHAHEVKWEFIREIYLALSAGYGVVLDDTFKERSSRRAMYSLAKNSSLEVLLLELVCPQAESLRRIHSDESRKRGSSSIGFCPTRDPHVVRGIASRWEKIRDYDYNNGKKHAYYSNVVYHSRFDSEQGKFEYNYKKSRAGEQFNGFVDDVRVCLSDVYSKWHKPSPEDTIPDSSSVLGSAE